MIFIPSFIRYGVDSDLVTSKYVARTLIKFEISKLVLLDGVLGIAVTS